MRLVLICFMFSFVSQAQGDTLPKRSGSASRIAYHELQIDPASIWLNKGFFYGHRINYQLHFKGKMHIELESNGTLFRGLDNRARRLKDDKVFPLLNQTIGVYTMDLLGKGKKINRNKQKRFVSSLRLGYHYFQHATPYFNYDYWAFDSTLQTGINSIRSFQSHSISVGIGFRSDKSKRIDGRMKKVASHKWSLDYLGNVYYQLSSYSINDSDQYNIQNIPNSHEIQKNGARFNYRYSRSLNSYFGIHFGAEAVLVPFLKDYSPNSDYFVPRGSERIFPLFVNTRIGVSFAF
ncbi:MAG: hypothetical protein HRT58_07405 [Crocinitomicaceae bacterium]|nr:hypothetical protein [Flavobacteriales bacterium]NQZ35476.1 hypothetical protein [Crocinitomicaceae bacterium]